jgi:hypothetical protein
VGAELVALVGADDVVEDFLVFVADLDDLGTVGGERSEVADVGAGELERVEEKSGTLVVNAAVEDGLHDLLNGDLDGVGVFEQRQLEAGIGFHADRSADAPVTAPAGARFVMPITEVGIAQRNGVAELAVGENVSAVSGFSGHKKRRA